MVVYLKVPYLGYRAVELVEKVEYRWRVTICGSGRELLVYDDEFEA